jgi:hypothetical protein
MEGTHVWRSIEKDPMRGCSNANFQIQNNELNFQILVGVRTAPHGVFRIHSIYATIILAVVGRIKQENDSQGRSHRNSLIEIEHDTVHIYDNVDLLRAPILHSQSIFWAVYLCWRYVSSGDDINSPVQNHGWYFHCFFPRLIFGSILCLARMEFTCTFTHSCCLSDQALALASTGLNHENENAPWASTISPRSFCLNSLAIYVLSRVHLVDLAALVIEFSKVVEWLSKYGCHQ